MCDVGERCSRVSVGEHAEEDPDRHVGYLSGGRSPAIKADVEPNDRVGPPRRRRGELVSDTLR